MSVNTQMTAIADKIRSLRGVSGTMGLDAMATHLGNEITGLNAALAALTEKGVTVPDGTKVDGLAALIAAIESGGGSGGANWGTITPVSYTNIIDFGVAIPEKNFFIAIMPYKSSAKSFGASYIYHFYYINIEGTENAFSQNTSPSSSKSSKPSFDRNNNTATFGTYLQGAVEYIWFMGGIV